MRKYYGGKMRYSTSRIILIISLIVGLSPMGFGDESITPGYPDSYLTEHIIKFGRELDNLADGDFITRCLLTLDYLEKYQAFVKSKSLKNKKNLEYQKMLHSHINLLDNYLGRLRSIASKSNKLQRATIESIIFRINQNVSIKKSVSGTVAGAKKGPKIQVPSGIPGVTVLTGGVSSHYEIPGGIRVIESENEIVFQVREQIFKIPKSLISTFYKEVNEGVSSYPDTYKKNLVKILENIKAFADTDPKDIEKVLPEGKIKQISPLLDVARILNNRKVFSGHEEIEVNLDGMGEKISALKMEKESQVTLDVPGETQEFKNEEPSVFHSLPGSQNDVPGTQDVIEGSRKQNLYGSVVLPDGSAIPGVAVTLAGGTIGTNTTVTSEEGSFKFLGLPPGNYKLKFELEGFKTVIREGVRLLSGKNRNLSIQMETTAIKEEIIVKEVLP